MKGYYISTTTFIASLIKGLKRNMSHLNITTPKQFESSICFYHPYTSICILNIFCEGETKEESQIDVE